MIVRASYLNDPKKALEIYHEMKEGIYFFREFFIYSFK